MRNKRRGLWVLLTACVAIVFSGCVKKTETDDMMRRIAEIPPPENLPQVIPSALVDQNGYVPGEEKIVIFRTESRDDTFEVRNAEDDAVVYTGSIRTKENGTRYGQFGSFQTPGSYYIYAEKTGSSYTFRIDDAIGSRLQNEALLLLKQLREEGKTDITTKSRVLCDLLLAYELNPDAFGDNGMRDDGGNEFPDILDEAREIAKSLPSEEKSSQEEAVLSACALAHAASVFSLFDPDFSEQCLSGAQRDWDKATTYGTLSSREDAFAAAGALYRMTGGKTYENVLTIQFRKEDYASLFQTDHFVFYGSVLYLLSRQPVNVAVRSTITDAVAEGAREIAKKTEEDAFFVSDGDTDQLLDNAVRLSVANHFDYNHGYNSILLNHIHYLSGRNPEAVNYLGTDTERTYEDSNEAGVPDHAGQLAKLVLLLGAS